MIADGVLQHRILLERVGKKLAVTGTATDQLLLTRWRVLCLCQFLVGGGVGEAEKLSVEALEIFVNNGPGRSTDKALQRAGSVVAHALSMLTGSILPQVTPTKQDEVKSRLEDYEALGSAGIEKALALLPPLRERLRRSPMGALLSGIRHRLDLVAMHVGDTSRSSADRQRAAAAILYLNELHDVIPDTLGPTGLLDDDFALRLILEEAGEYTEDERLHWAERISALWDDLPFLQGVRLRRDEAPVATTWLDRINSYISYTHAFDGTKGPLIIVQPSVACSPLHSIISLIGLLILDGITSSRNLFASLCVGKVYAIDGKFYARYEGPVTEPEFAGWLRLRFRDCDVLRPPTIADRMVAVGKRPLSSCRAFSSQGAINDAEPIQKFFDWDEAIGTASLTSRILLVTSKKRATQLLEGVRSNGVSLLDDGLVRFAGTNPSPDLIRSGLVLVVPTVGIARQVVEQGVTAHAIVVDEYERLNRGRHDLPFLFMRPSPPPIIVWSATGYYPDEAPSWLPQHRRLQIAPDDLPYVLELDGDLDVDSTSQTSLWEAATSTGFQQVTVPWTLEEQQVLESINAFKKVVRKSAEIPDYWKYHLFSSATTLRTLVTATPAAWNDIREFSHSWDKTFQEQWGRFRRRAKEQLLPIAQAHSAIMRDIERVSANENSKASALLEFIEKSGSDGWHVVCDRREQVKIGGRFVRRHGLKRVKLVRLRDLGVCKACIVLGWRTAFFARCLPAHTPRSLVALVDESEAKRWKRLQAKQGLNEGESLLEAIGHVTGPIVSPAATTVQRGKNEDIEWQDNVTDRDETLKKVPCAFVWLVDECEGKVLERDSRVLVEAGDKALEKPVYLIAPEDRVILGSGADKWSPADEFTHSVVEAIQASHPDLIKDVREWRRALKSLQDDRGWTTDQLREQLARFGVTRGTQTLDGWLRLEQAPPIGPRSIRRELEAMWPLIAGNTTRSVGDVANACCRLRALRIAAGNALIKLWKGEAIDLGVDDLLLEGLVDQLRQEVQVYEVEDIYLGTVPEAMVGWWVSPDLAVRYRSCAVEEGDK